MQVKGIGMGRANQIMEEIQKMKTNPDCFKKTKGNYPLIPRNFNRNTVGQRLPFIGKRWNKKISNHETLTEKFKKRFDTGESLFDCTVEQITEVCGITESGE